jgi:hypothetical protein
VRLAQSKTTQAMVYIKSTLVGILALFVATIVYVVSLAYVFLRKYPPPPGTHVGINLLVLLDRPLYWLIAVAAFALGFYWEFRRA